MIPVSTLYDEYIDRRKLTEQKKTHLIILFLPHKWVGTINDFLFKLTYLSVEELQEGSEQKFNCVGCNIIGLIIQTPFKSLTNQFYDFAKKIL